ncbi:type VI secretion system baseplate subunit TssK [Chryseobacterium sp. YIM B08800]|uniref:type VI secretion system baseplate subunit TssK n=1 Tax=Chryseobacterium sp. YIM B08800 TaxID=2984136 RepID=UPI00224050D4|nr:type VI secretion system baseplate subunit TssK [Chryseobacterium sp. YIM B08800]
MIEKLNHFPVNWIDGMKINKTHFNDMQDFVSDSARDAIGVHTSMINYGLLPVNDSIKMNLIIDNHQLLRIKVEKCHAITPNGARIDIEASESLSLSIPYPETVRELKENESTVLLACISVNHFKRTPYGEPDPEENPPRYPYTHPEYSLNLIPEDELKNTIGFGANYLTIGKILVNSGESKIDDNYIPPSTSVASHQKLQDLYTEIDRFYGQIELYAVQIAQKIHAKKQTNELATMMEMMSDKTLNYLGMEINRLRWMSPHTPPANMLLSVVALARILKNFIDARSGAGKEELLNYFAEWCNVSQGDFEMIFSETINTDYNHNQMDNVISKIVRFMKTLEDLFSILSRLDYIGKKRDGSIFVSENTDEREAVIHAKRSRTFLAD